MDKGADTEIISKMNEYRQPLMQSLECAVSPLVRTNYSYKLVVSFLFGLVAFPDIRENFFKRFPLSHPYLPSLDSMLRAGRSAPLARELLQKETERANRCGRTILPGLF